MGCGRIARKSHTEAIVRNRDVIECVAVCDIVGEKAETLADHFEKEGLRKPEVFVNYKEILKRQDIDAVVVATESGKHYEITMEALESGKHVLVEKPMALSIKHIDEMIETSKRKSLKLGVCFQNRFNPPIQELRKRIDEDAFGRINYGVIQVRWNRNKEYYSMAPWEEVFGTIKNFSHPDIETEDFGGAIIKFKNGSIGIVEATSTIYPRNLEEKLSIFGERGTVVVGGLAMNRIEVWKFPGEDGHPFMNLPDPETVYGHGHVPLYRDFYEAISKDKEPYISGEEGKKAVEIVLAIYKSALENSPVKFPLKDFSTMDVKKEMEGKLR
ncbi:MAG: oxidoreductase [Thermotoga sp. 4484_232]|nr:MAG: oxidoreductase [Thermotoga sp. 4484_232]